VSAFAVDVLVVEDDEDLRLTIVDLLREEGIVVAGASNGLEALAWMRAHGRPRVILLDLMMPVMGGVLFREAQLADPAVADVPVVLMTASTVEAISLEVPGVEEVVRKPMPFATLLAVVRRYVT
jgi:CheY-like chemotaxis protein